MHLSLAAIALLVAVVIAFVALNPRLLRNPVWSATVTPLASIIGSGFLVAGPILAHTVGNWSWLAMTGLCLTAYLFGSAIRHNIRTVEPMLDNDGQTDVKVIERVSHFALAFAYFISVAYYLNLFAAFVLRGVGITAPEIVRVLSSIVILGIGVYGALRGLRGLESLEKVAGGVKLSAIGGLIAAMTAFLFSGMSRGTLSLHEFDHATGLHELQILLGLVILVQGFETSRFLGSEYDCETRIRTMRYAQWSSAAIYVVFVVLMTPFFDAKLPAEGGETAIIDTLAPLGVVAAPASIIAAIGSQLSAAVADANGASGLLNDATARRVSMRMGYAVTAGVAVAITWSANIYEIIAHASKAFVLYYGIQSVLSALVSFRSGGRSRQFVFFCLAALLALAIVTFGTAAEA